MFLTFGIGLIIHSLTDFFTYNFTTTLFIIMRSNSSIIAEFIFGTLLCISGIQIFVDNKNWLNSIKALTIGILVNLVFSFSLSAFTYAFGWWLAIEIVFRALIGFGIYKLTVYLIRTNESEWNIKGDKLSLIIGIVIGLFPFLFRNMWF